MSATPRATPVVPSPDGMTTSRRTHQRKQLVAPIVVVTSLGEWELERGELIVGRDREAQIQLDEPLVSRFHARIRIGAQGEAIVEDLHSANGVRVNGARMMRTNLLLGDGDRILIGTTEISVFSVRKSSEVELGETLTRTIPSSRRNRNVPPETSGDISTHREVEPRASTGRTDTTSLVGQHAEQLINSGHHAQGIRVLEEHLDNVMKGASAGLPVPDRILEGVTSYAFKLHDWTKRSSWLSYSLDLHHLCHSIPSDHTLEVLARYGTLIERSAPGLLASFLAAMAPKVPTLSLEEITRLKRFELWAETVQSSVPESGRR